MKYVLQFVWHTFRAWLSTPSLVAIFLCLPMMACKPKPPGGWVLFVPRESSTQGCRMLPTEDPNGRIMDSYGIARYAITPMRSDLPVKKGERYHLHASVMPTDDFHPADGSPGVVLRATLFTPDGHNFENGHYYISKNGVTVGPPGTVERDHGIPEAGPILLDGVVEIPDGVGRLRFYIFCWNTRGAVRIRDALCEKVGAEIDLSPIIGRHQKM